MASARKPQSAPDVKRDVLDTKVRTERVDKCLKVVRSRSRAASPSRGLEPCIHVLLASNATKGD
jgi:hypothetical protein